jgi:hypothetical protein
MLASSGDTGLSYDTARQHEERHGDFYPRSRSISARAMTEGVRVLII